MSQLVKTKCQANFKQSGASKGLVEQKNVVFNSFVCKLGSLWHSWAFKTFETGLLMLKKPDVHMNSLNKLLLSRTVIFINSSLTKSTLSDVMNCNTIRPLHSLHFTEGWSHVHCFYVNLFIRTLLWYEKFNHF
jgi:hypothetical protein